MQSAAQSLHSVSWGSRLLMNWRTEEPDNVSFALRIAAGAAALSLLATAIPLRAAPADAPVFLQPHRAVYEFTLDTARKSNTVSAVSGRMVYEFTGSVCDGYTQTMRFVTRTTAQDGETMVSDQRSTGSEDAKGTRFQFSSSQFQNQKAGERTSGTAVRVPDGDTKVALTVPERRSATVGGEALFPIQHSIKLIERARRGETMFLSDFYDGSEGGEKTYRTFTLIGKPQAPGYNRRLPKAGASTSLDALRAWPIAMSYYEQTATDKDAPPAYEMSFLYFENGISRRLYIDNGEYTLRGDLKELVLLDPGKCR